MPKRLTLLIFLFITIFGALLYVIISYRHSNHEAVKEIITSKVPQLSEAQLKDISMVIHTEMNRVDKNRKPRVRDLLVAIEQSPNLERALNSSRSELEEQLFREQLRNVVDWFLSTDPPSPQERQEIEAHIDQIVSIAVAIGEETFPESEAQIAEYTRIIRSCLMELYNDALIPTLKRPLSPGEIEEIEASLREEQRRIEAKFKRDENDVFASEKRSFLTHTSIPRLLTAVYSPIEEFYALPANERQVQLGEEVKEEWKQRHQIGTERMHRAAVSAARKALEEHRAAMEAQDMEAQDRAQSGNDLYDSAELGDVADTYKPVEDAMSPWSEDSPSSTEDSEIYANQPEDNTHYDETLDFSNMEFMELWKLFNTTEGFQPAQGDAHDAYTERYLQSQSPDNPEDFQSFPEENSGEQ